MIEISQYTTRSGTGYQVSLTLSNMNGGSYTVIVGGVTGQPRTANGTLVETITAVDGSGLRIVASTGVTGFIDQVSMNAISIPSTTGITAGKAGTNNPVSTWRARRGSLVLNQPTASRRPILQGGGVVFDGVDDFLVSAISLVGDFTIFALANILNPGTSTGAILGINTVNYWSIRENDFWLNIDSAGPSVINFSGSHTGSSIYVLIRQDGIVSGFRNGNKSSSTLAMSGNFVTNRVMSRTTSNFTQGTLKTLAIYNRALSDLEIQKLEAYYNA